MLTAGIDLAAQPTRTGAVIIDWSGERPTVVDAAVKVTDVQVLALCHAVALEHGRVGIDCPFGWPRPFLAFVAAHAANEPLPTMESDTRHLRLRATDIALRQRLRITPLSVSTNMLGVTALRVARLFAAMRECGMPVDRTGRGTVCEVYPAASRLAWGLSLKERDLTELVAQLRLKVLPAEQALLANEHVFDALVAALTARAVALGATDSPSADQEDVASEEGWIHVPSTGHRLVALTFR